MVGLLAVSCHLGRPPPSALRLRVGEVRATAAEPALEEDLTRALSATLAQHGVLGSGPEVRAHVLSVDVVPVASASGAQVARVRLEVAFELLGARPRRVVLSAQRAFTRSPDDALGASDARAEAFAALAGELAEDAVDWLLYGPGRTP